MFTMTYNEAMTIQRAQMAYYRQIIGRAGCKAIRMKTSPPIGDPDKPMRVIDINRLVPRGGDLETLFAKRLEWKPCDPTSYDWHNAIRRGLFYSV